MRTLAFSLVWLCGIGGVTYAAIPRATGRAGREPYTWRTHFQTYRADGRRNLQDLYRAHDWLRTQGWVREQVYVHSQTVDGKRLRMPMYFYRTPKEGPALWLFAQVHGEEPAGSNAFALRSNLMALVKLAESRGIPVVVAPLLNAKGYRNNWRFPNTPSIDYSRGRSVSDSEPFLLGSASEGQDPDRPRVTGARNPPARSLVTRVFALSQHYPPVLSIDFHEDAMPDPKTGQTGSYVYSQGKLGARDPAARFIAAVLRDSGLPMRTSGETRFEGEQIIDGVVVRKSDQQPVQDGSIDEFMAQGEVWMGARRRSKVAATSSVVVETSTDAPLRHRVAVMGKIIRAAGKLWDLTPRP
jgi:hypothetical protein